MSEMIERVAKAITTEFATQNRLMFERHQHTVDATALARAAIKAMREPTTAMTRAAVWSIDKAKERDGLLQEPRPYRAPQKHAIRWQAMIDAALTKQP